jgi:hypothetical protein
MLTPIAAAATSIDFELLPPAAILFTMQLLYFRLPRRLMGDRRCDGDGDG